LFEAQEVHDLGEAVEAKAGGTLTYTITFKTQTGRRPDAAATFKINLKSLGGSKSTGGKPNGGLHPGFKVAQAAYASAGSATTYEARGPNDDTETVTFTAEDIGEIGQVSISGQNTAKGGWSPDWVKVDTNSGGIGNGVYFVHVGKTIDSETDFATPANSYIKADMLADADYDSLRGKLVKCEADSCEEEMNQLDAKEYTMDMREKMKKLMHEETDEEEAKRYEEMESEEYEDY